MKNFLSKATAIAMLLLPGFAFAAFNDVLLGPTNTILSVNSATVTVASATTTLESIVVNASTFDLTFAAGSNITITAPSLSVTAMSVTQSLTTSCSSGVTTLTITAAVAGTATIMPSTTACGAAAAASGGNGPIASSGGGGGGGGGGLPPLVAPTAPTVPVKAPAPVVPVSQGVSLSFDFGIGEENSAVTALQTFLENKGFLKLPFGIAKGYFGALTKQALIAYQKSVGISGTGYAGPKTRAAINGTQSSAPIASAPATAGGAFARDLEVGVVGNDVQQLQMFLNAHGFVIASSGPGSPGSETTRFGALTRAALAKFQSANGIAPAAGYFGPKTRAAVNAMK